MIPPHVHSASLPDGVIDEAIAWHIRLNLSASACAAQTGLDAWLERAHEHRIAWQRVNEISSTFKSLPAKSVGATLLHLEQRERAGHVSRRQALRIFSAGCLLLGGGWLARDHTPWQRLVADSSTQIGERKSLALEGGGSLVMNTDSAISLDMGRALRRVLLRRGEVMVEALPDQAFIPGRPLVVETPVGQIQTLAAQVLVRLDREGARVSVSQGKVSISNHQGVSRAAIGGDSLWLTPAQITSASPSPIPADAWLRGVVSGADIPLGALLDELARYRPGVIRYSPEVAALTVSGAFHLVNAEKTLQFLSQLQPLRIQFHTRYWVTVDIA